MKEIIKVFVILFIAVFAVPLLWLLIKEIWWLIVPLFVGLNFWAVVFVIAIIAIIVMLVN